MLGSDIIADRLILLQLVAMPQVSADKYDDENGDDDADDKGAGFSSGAINGCPQAGFRLPPRHPALLQKS